MENKQKQNNAKNNKNLNKQTTSEPSIQHETPTKAKKGTLSGLLKKQNHEHNHPRYRRNQKFYYAFLFVLAVLAFLFLPNSFVKENQGELVAIVTSVGIDREKDSSDYLVTCQLIAPDTTGQNQQKVAVVNEKGKTITDAFTNLSLKLGKNVGFDHCSVVAIGESLNGEELLPILDHFYREGKISLNAVLVNVKGAAVDLVKESSELNNLSSGSIQNNFNFNKDFFGSSKISTLGVFFNEYFKKGSSCIVAEINMNYNETKVEPAESPNSGESGCDSKGGTAQSGGGGESGGQPASSGASSGGGDSGSGCQELQSVSIIQNNGDSIIYKHSKAITRASKEVNNGFNYLDNRVKYGILQVENVTDSNLHDATVAFAVKDSFADLKPYVDKENNKFVLKVHVKISGEITEIVEDHQTKKITKSYKDLLSDELKNKMGEKIKEQIALALQFCKLNNVDALNLEDMFYKLKTSDYNNLKRKLNINDDNFLEFVDIETKTSVYHQN